MFVYRLMSHVADVNSQSSVGKFHFIISFIALHLSFVLLFQVVLHHFILFIFHDYNQNWINDV